MFPAFESCCRANAIATVVMLCVSACGGHGATVPDTIALPLRPGLQLLTLTGFASSVDPAYPPCVPFGQPRDGTAVTTVVNLTADGQDWVARSSSTGTLQLRLRSTGSSTSGYIVSGTISGSATDIGLNGLARDVSITASSASGSGAAVVDATASFTSSFVVGRATGTLKFSDSQGQSSSCTAIQLSMQPY